MRNYKTAPRRVEDPDRKLRMERKRDFNASRHERRKAHLKKTGGDRVYANLSRFHPDYGMTPQQHEEQKALRKAGKVKFDDKKGLAKRRGALARAYGL